LEELRKLWKQNGINGPFFTADGPTAFMLEAGNIDGAAIGLDSGGNDNDFEQAKKRNPSVPSFSSETYPGWLTHWGEKWSRPDTNELKKEIEYLLKNKRSFNLYVAHGGTNFGFSAGANAFSPVQYQPDITSYDYDAPVNEQGQPTPKYFLIRKLISQYTGSSVPDIPASITTIEIPEISIKTFTDLWNNLPIPVLSAQPKTLESLDQREGLILYKTKLVGHKSGKLTITEPHDRAMVFLNGSFMGEVMRDGGKWTIDIPATASETKQEQPVLEILVEPMGRINYGQFMIDRKGITDRVTLNGMTLMNWEIYKLPFDNRFITGLKPAKPEPGKKCNFFKGNFSLSATGDVYFDMSQYTKGILYVNGHNLGRYWNIGPQQRLYCPGVWLRKGNNEIIVFDFNLTAAKPITGKRTLE
jgi:beta-galactosidase